MSAPEAGRVIAGRYRLDRALAKGGMGCVWIGHHLQLDIGVAVKMMAPELAASPEARARFEREAKASAQLRIANAVQIYDFGVDGDAPFLVMELLEGEDLEAKLAREGRLSPAETWAILEQICRGLRRAHEVGIVHRDLKPANVFLSRRGAEEAVKLLDFGIAKAVGPAQGPAATRTGVLMGSPHYMSPEQVRTTSKVDLRTDLWAAGVIAFRCLTGQLPFPGEEVGEVLVDVCTRPIPVASQIAPWLRTPGTDVDRFFAKALSRDPAQRFQSATELGDAFTALVLGAGPPGVAVAPADGGLVAQPTVMGPAPIMAPPPAATLSPSSQTWNGAPPAASTRGSMGIVVAAIGALVAAVALIVGLFLALRSPTAAPVAAATPLSTAPAAPASATAPPDSSAKSGGADSAPSGAPSVSGAASSAPVPSASASVAPGAKPSKSTPARNPPPGRKSDDLLNHI